MALRQSKGKHGYPTTSAKKAMRNSCASRVHHYMGKHAGLGSGLRRQHLHKKQSIHMTRTKARACKEGVTRALAKHHTWLKAPHPPPLAQQSLTSMGHGQKNPPGQTHSVDQRPSLGCRPVGWRWGPRSTGTASEHLQLVLATATIALPPVSPWPLKRKNTSPNTCHQRTMSIPGLLPLPCPC